MSWRCCMETKPLCHSCMLTRVGKWHMGNTVSFSHGHSRQAVPGHHQSNRYSSLGQSAWFSRLGTTVPSNSVHCCNLKKKKNQQKGGPAVSPVLGSLAEGGWEWENHRGISTCGSLAGQNHMLSGLFHTTLHSVNKMDF